MVRSLLVSSLLSAAFLLALMFAMMVGTPITLAAANESENFFDDDDNNDDDGEGNSGEFKPLSVDDPVPQGLLDAIKCPACDYTAGYLIKKALAAHRLCGRKSVETFNPITFRDGSKNPKDTILNAVRNVEGNAGYEDVKSGEDADGCVKFVHTYAADGISGGTGGSTFTTLAASKHTIGSIFDTACTEGVMKAFPIGTRAIPRQPAENDTMTAEQKMEVLKTFKPEPADPHYRKSINMGCGLSYDKLPKGNRLTLKRYLYDLTVTAAGDGRAWDEVDAQNGGGKAMGPTLYARRNGDYKKILAFQQKTCDAACGEFPRAPNAGPNPPIGSDDDHIERPERPRKKADAEVSYSGMISWNADGEIISRDHI